MNKLYIARISDPKYYYTLILTDDVPITATLLFLKLQKEAWIDVHLEELITKGVDRLIFPHEQSKCISLLFIVLGV